MIEQTIQWVALPNGLTDEGATLRLSVFVAPRLRTDEVAALAPFADWLAWPERVAAATFAVEIDGGASIPAAVTSPPPDLRLWQALFSAETPLAPFRFDDFSDRPIVSYDQRGLLRYVRERYGRLAAAASDDLPLARPQLRVDERPALSNLFAELVDPLLQGEHDPDGRLAERLERARSLAAARRANPALRGATPIEPIPADGTPGTEFERLRLFHHRPPGEPNDLGGDEQAGERLRVETDFHQMISALGDHPALLRALGLVIDLAIPADQVPLTDEFTRGRLRIVPSWASSLPDTTSDRGPWTQYVHAREERLAAFAPMWRGASGLGFLQLPPELFEAAQLDADGAALKLLGMANTLAGRLLHPERPIDEDPRAGVPALRTGGLAVVAGERARQLSEAFTQARHLNEQLEQSADSTLFAEELTRAFRLDIFDAADGAWRSLHQRVVSYATLADPEAAPPPVSDEGFAQLGITEPAVAPGARPDPNAELYAHETLLTWDGWSLSAPRPGKSISRNPRAPRPDDPETQPQRVENRAITAMQLAIDSAVQPGTLPRLRFGRPYRLRVRTVDLAGNGPTVAEADALLTLFPPAGAVLPPDEPLVFRRFEPLPAPALAPRARFGEGESLERLVIRSNFDRGAADEAADLNAAVAPAEPYTATNERHVAAPKAALDLVEKHGMLDTAFTTARDGLDEAAARAAMQAAYEVARREKGALDDPGVPGVELVTIPGSAPEEPPQRYAVHREEQLALPYLPDPLAQGAVFFGLPGVAPGEPTAVLFDAPAWHEARPFRLRLDEGEGPPEWDTAARVLTVRLPKAATVTVRMSSLFGGDLDQMALWRWCEELRNLPAPVLSDADLERIAQAAKESRHWMFTPWRTLTLVHATRQPLEAPDVFSFEAARPFGSTLAHLRGEASLHLPSTERADLVASWSEWVDDPATPEPVRRESAAPVFSIPLAEAIASKNIEALAWLDDRVLRFNSGIADGRGLPPAQQFSDTHHRQVRYELLAASRFRDYFPATITSDRAAISRASAPLDLALPSTAPPAPPRVQYIVPTFAWSEGVDEAGTISSARQGGGLRVYLDRPWFSSGDGELLGVVLLGVSSPISADYPYASLLGRDPLWASAPAAVPTPATFLNAEVVSPPLSLREINERATVVGFTPQFDAATQRWFCDLQLDTGNAYFPFVRLALVRYQPNALEGAHLSRVTLADSVQTFPDRAATVSRDPNDPALLQIVVLGVSYFAVSAGIAGERDPRPESLSQISAELQRRDPAIADETLGWAGLTGATALLESQRGEDGQASWAGSLRIPDEAAGERLRLILVERERFPGDELDEVRERPVYLDVLGL